MLVDISLHTVHLTPTKQSKTSLYSVNICLGEDPTTITALKSDCKGKKDGNSNNISPFSSMQDSIKDISSLIDTIKIIYLKEYLKEACLIYHS